MKQIIWKYKVVIYFVLTISVVFIITNRNIFRNSSTYIKQFQRTAFDFFLASQHTRPNLLIFFVDDWGWGDLGANVGKDAYESETPFMDDFAKRSIRFQDFHVASSICTPSRAALLTGRLGLRTGVNGLLGPASTGGLPRSETTLSEYLKQQNYSTFAIGKWHLGHVDKYHPLNRGFDHYFGVPYSIDQGCLDYPGYIYPDRLDCSTETTTAFGALPLIRDKTIIEQPLDLKRLSNQYVNEFRKRMLDIKKRNVNFFGYVPFSKVHVPLGFSDRYQNITSSIYGDNLRELDHTFAKMINTLEELELSENTVVWLAGDNGPWQSNCGFGGSVGPLHGGWQLKYGGGGATGKLTVWEGGHRVPGVVSWPRYIKEGKVSTALVSSMDILPTMAKLIGFPLLEDRVYDGKDISDILKGESDEGHEVLFHPRSDGRTGEITAVRYKNYKVVFKSGGQRLLDCSQKHGPLITHNPPLIFNLHKDIGEEVPLNPTILEHREILDQVKKILEDKNRNIANDKKSTFDEGKDANVMPCCNKSNKHCRCNALL